MKTKALFGLLCLTLATAGCATMGRRPGYLIYYDVADAGAVWCWEDHYGWRYLGEREFWWSRTHGGRPDHRPGDDDHKKHPPGDDDHKKHPPGQPPPGDAHTTPGDGHRYPPHPGEKPPWHGQYLFFGADGTVFGSRDGTSFNPMGRVGSDGQIVRQEAPTEYRGSFDSTANSFSVASRPAHQFSGWLGAVLGNAGGDGGYGGGGYPGSSSGFGSGDRGSYSGSSYPGSSSYSGGSGYSSGSSGFSGDNNVSNSSSMSSGGGGFSGGGGGGSYSSGSGAVSSGDSNVDHAVNKEQ